MNSYTAMNNNILSSALPVVVPGSIVSILPIAGYSPANERLKYKVDFNAKAIKTKIDLSAFGIRSLDSQLFDFVESEARASFNFGIDRVNGFYIEAPAQPFILGLALNIPESFRWDAVLGPITVGIRPELDIRAEVQVALRDPNNDNRITTQEMRDQITSVLNVSATGGVDASLDLGGYLGDSSGPGFVTSFDAHWSLSTGELTYGSSHSKSIEDGFSGIQFYAGEFVKKTVGNFLERINSYNPIPADVAEFLTSKIDIIEETPLALMRKAGIDIPEWVDMLLDAKQLTAKLAGLATNSVDLRAYLPNQNPPMFRPIRLRLLPCWTNWPAME